MRDELSMYSEIFAVSETEGNEMDASADSENSESGFNCLKPLFSNVKHSRRIEGAPGRGTSFEANPRIHGIYGLSRVGV